MFIRWVGVLLLCLGLIILIGCTVNPLTGDDEFMLYTEDYDFEIGEKLAPELERALDERIPNDDLQAYINRVGQNVARVCHHPEWEYHYTAVESNQVNALALPGGYIFITRGMLEKLESEAQLAAILGHETAHVVGRDSANALSKQIGMQLASVAAAVADPSAGAGAFYASQFLMLTYSREDETQADISGLHYMVEAGYDPQGMIDTMQVLESQMKRRPIEFFSTHPLPENRLHLLHQLIENYYPTASASKRVGKTTYQKEILDYLKANPYPEKEIRRKRRQYQRRGDVSEETSIWASSQHCNCWIHDSTH
ncbi:M48 family metallopeptidase [Planctomycetota bacterium]